MSPAVMRGLPVLAVAGCVLVGLSGCGEVSNRALRASVNAFAGERVTATTPTVTRPQPRCGDPTASLRPAGALPAPGRMPAGTFMRTIQDRGRLIVGVDQNSLLLGYFNPLSGRIEGFDIDMLRQIAAAILGNPNAIEFKAISSAQRLPAIESQSVDIVADAMTITCERARKVAFTTVYYEAGQRILVPSNSSIHGVGGLSGRRVCAVEGSTSIENIKRLAPRAIPYPVALRTDCLVALQEGKVDAISTDDAILAGFRAQDPYTQIVGPRLHVEPYGMAINKRHPDFVRFVNGVLERERGDGSWKSIYERWLGRATHVPAPAPPKPHYRD